MRASRRARPRAVLLAVVLGVPAAALVPLAASGQSAPSEPRPPTKDAVERYDPDNVTAISMFMETLLKGNERYAAKDFPGAIDTYKKAMQLNPRSPLGPYLVGEAQLASNNLGEAEAAFKQAEELSDSKNPLLRSHVLFCVADVLEREKKWEQARAAWLAYTEHASKLGADGGAFPQSGTARLKAIEAALGLEKQYVLVRERIRAEKDRAADAGATPARSKK